MPRKSKDLKGDEFVENEYQLYAEILTLLNTLAAFSDGATGLNARRQLNRLLTNLDERDLMVTYHPETQSYTVSDMPKG